MPVFAQIFSPTQWFLLILICLVVFGAKRLPELARNLGKSLAAFRKAKEDFEKELMKPAPSDEPEGKKDSVEKESSSHGD